MEVALWILVIALIVVLFILITPRREGFTIHQRDHILCYPFLNGREDWLLPDSVVFVIQGYNYQNTPKIYRDQNLITPLQYSWDYHNMAYYFAVYAPQGLCDSQWVVETSDDVKPVINEGRSGALLNVREAGHRQWLVFC